MSFTLAALSTKGRIQSGAASGLSGAVANPLRANGSSAVTT
ncbi:Uncharacterised protein [Mycobacteroides abscessus subsp. abscessus]|nr:Uncharacterised protein [Mycobacteroides abscessus subsp. abscessus]